MLVKGPQECAILYQIRLCYTKPDCTSICYEKWNNASSHVVHNMLYIYVKLLISAHDPDVSHKNTNFHFNLTNFNPTSIMFSKVLRDTDNTCPGTQSIYLEVTFNTSRPRQNGRHFSDNISNAFLQWKCLDCDQNFTEVYSHGSNWQNSSIGSDNGLAPNKRQVIVWTNDGQFTDAYIHHSDSVS